jgi:membrane protease YdiL (CAAX protease family)
MRELAKILVFAALSIALGCLLAPLLYGLGHAVAATGVLTELSRFQFHRYFNRAALLAAALLVWPLLRALGIRRWSDLSLAPNPARWRHLGLGFGVATVGLWAVAGLMLAIGRAHWRAQPRLDMLPGALLSAVAVALIEESFFRGALFGALRRTLRWPTALMVLSVVFAAVHFLRPPPGLTEPTVSWSSGFELLPGLLWQYGQPRLVVGGFLTILLVGLVLGWAVVRTRSLYLSLGLHAGWVFALKAFGALTSVSSEGGLWFGRDLLTGLAPVLLVASTGVLLMRLLPQRDGTGVPALPGLEARP